MARKKAHRDDGPGRDDPPPEATAETRTETTGRYLVVLADDCVGNPKRSLDALRRVGGVNSVATSDEYEENAVDMAEAGTADAVVFSGLGVAVVASDGDLVTAWR